MVVTPFTAVGTSSAVLTLSKEAWKLSIALSKLFQDAKIVDTTIKKLVEEVKSLGIECDLVYAGLEEVVSNCETGSSPYYDLNERILSCLATQVEETRRTFQELELFMARVRRDSNLIGEPQRQRHLNKRKDHIADIRAQVHRHIDNLRTTLLLINTVLAQLAPCRPDRRFSEETDKLQDIVKKLKRPTDADPQSRLSHTEATLIQCARYVIVQGTTMYEASLAEGSVGGGQGAATSRFGVGEWMSTLKSIRQDQRCSKSSDLVSKVPSILSKEKSHPVLTSAISTQRTMQEHKTAEAVGDDSDEDLDTDLTKAALDTGTKAFEAQEWEEADSLLQEALRVLQQLPNQQRAFCDIFDLHFKLAVCAYHTQDPADAEEALMSLVQQSASSDEQRRCIYDATHLLSQLYIRMSQVDRARAECEKALQSRRRLLGKLSDASLQSTALMAHIYVLLNNRARAKSCLAMIPEASRDTILRNVEESLGAEVEHLNFSSLLSRSIAGGDSDLGAERIQSIHSVSTLESPLENGGYDTESAMTKTPAASLLQSPQLIQSDQTGFQDLRSGTVTSVSSARGASEPRARGKERSNEDYSTDPITISAVSLSLDESLETSETSKGNTLSRKEILDRIGCQPKDEIEQAVCDGDHSTLARLLNRKKDFWRSKFRKRVRPERVTALHFAALFGEVDMARRLLASSFNIHDIPYGYTTSLTPLKFAIGARQVEMVAFLIASGARPSEPDSWSTLAGQLMNRSWLTKTMSETEKVFVPNRIVMILSILLDYGWDVNVPFDTSGGTVLHQAVAFWTGSQRWDLNLRVAITSFLCQRGADPFRVNTEGKTPYDLASAFGHQELLLVLDQDSKMNNPGVWLGEPVELSV